MWAKTGKGCVIQLFMVRQLCEKLLAKGKDLFRAFCMSLYGVGGKLLEAVQSFYEAIRHASVSEMRLVNGSL